jgi:hypothetical protein
MRGVKSVQDLEKWKKDILAKQKPHEAIISVCGGTGCQAYGCQEVKNTGRPFIRLISLPGPRSGEPADLRFDLHAHLPQTTDFAGVLAAPWTSPK